LHEAKHNAKHDDVVERKPIGGNLEDKVNTFLKELAEP